jgi:hypothetical protein
VSEKVNSKCLDYIFSFKKGSLQKIDSEFANLTKCKKLHNLAKVKSLNVYSSVPDKPNIYKLFKVPNLKQILYNYNFMDNSRGSIPIGFERNWKIICEGEATGYKRTGYIKIS